MSTENMPVSSMRMAVVRAARKPIAEQSGERQVKYSDNSTFYNALKTARAGADPRNALNTQATTFKTSNALYIANETVLKGLFPGFALIDDYLRVQLKDSVKADLKTLIEGSDVLNQSANAYIGGAGYAALRSRIWDNVFALTILGQTTALRTEEVKILRLLNIIEKIAANDPLLDTGQGIVSAYFSTVLLPADVFPLPDVVLPTEPVTQAAPPDTLSALKTRLTELQGAYADIIQKYDHQTYEYKTKSYPIRNEEDPDDDLQPNVLDHDPLALNKTNGGSLRASTLAELSRFNISRDFVYMPYIHEKFGSEIRKIGRLVNAKKERQMAIRVDGALIMLGNECVQLALESPCKPFVFAQWSTNWPNGAGHIRPIGIADLKVVNTQLYKYELGEVAHVENVLKGEIRKRTFRDLQRQESTLEEEQETVTTNEKETQSTERFELQQEAQNVIQQDQAAQSGVSVSAAYGPVSGSLSSDNSSSTSQLQATSQATSYAKEVMERALQRVIEKKRTKRTVTTIVETEDTVEHGFDNTTNGAGGTDNVTGVYRWLDKIYYNQVVNYGRRMMFEFIIPEPASFYLFAKLAKPKTDEVFEAPPPFEITSFEEITIDKYDEFVVRYGATGIKPPPQGLISVQASTSHDPTSTQNDEWTTWATQLTVPTGYYAFSARVSLLLSQGTGQYITISVGTTPPVTRYESEVVDITDIPEVSGEIPINMRCKSSHYAIAVNVFCKPSAETLQQWQIDTFNAIKAAYDQRVSEYNRWLNQQQVGRMVYGNNPARNREIERKELKKHCIEFVSGQRFESFDALRNNVAPFGYPEFSFVESAKEGRYIQFFEQAFEWEQMTYNFYPYYWARKKEWVNIIQRDENDPVFMNFLQAGAVRVLVPVRNTYVKAILHYLNTGGEIWNGEDVPAPDDPMYVSILDEIMEQDGTFQGGTIEGDPWLSKVPTSLVYLTHGNSPNDLPDFSAGLPL